MTALLAIVGFAGLTLMSTPVDAAKGGGFMPCPFPPCAAPCILGEEPDVICKSKDSGKTKTTFACCCCGSAGNLYKFLPSK
jgi:hypothetical protein